MTLLLALWLALSLLVQLRCYLLMCDCYAASVAACACAVQAPVRS
jgi:hypothetical protein